MYDSKNGNIREYSRLMPNIRDEPRLGQLALHAHSQRVEKKTSSPRARGCFLVLHTNNTKRYFERQPNAVESKIKGLFSLSQNIQG